MGGPARSEPQRQYLNAAWDDAMTDLAFRSATELAADIRARKIGCRELLEHYLARIERYNPTLNAVIAMDLEWARGRADEADAALARGENWGPLHGIPMTVKESYDVEGFVTSWGAPEFKDYRPVRSAISVERLMAAGAIIFGKTNVPLFLGDLQTHNKLYGTTRSPWDLDRTPGGSSGGAVAALAAGLTALEAGSDIASSIRTPAHYCGVYGHKPTYGVITTRGQLIPGRVAFSDLAVIGPMARSAADLALALEVMAGPDETDCLAWCMQLPKPRKQRLADYRVAVMLNVPHAEVDLGVQEQIRQVAEAVARAGATVSFTARPDIDTEEADQLFHRLLGAALSGRQSADAFGNNLETLSRLGPDDSRNLARALRAATLSHRDWLIANETRHRMRLKWAEFFKDYDLLLCPAAATVAPLHNHEGDAFERPITVNGKQVPLSTQFFWAGYSGLALLPSTVAPAGMTPQGLPVGVQIVGPQYGDLTCIHFAGLLEQSYRKFVPPPGY
jgi:amidase